MKARPIVARPDTVPRARWLTACGAAMLMLIASGYLELQGLRILSPELSLTQAWSTTYVLGALRTAVGAASLGAFAVGSGLLLRPIRRWTRRRWPFVWGAGAALFLIALAGLVRWAP